ncbi:ParA family protein [Paenibacillus sp. strain BS8-2]
MAKVVSMLNMKGGVGKTTLAYNLSWYAAYCKAYKVLAIDLDPQSNLSQSFLGEGGYHAFLGENRPSVVDLFEDGSAGGEVITEIEQWTDGGRLHLIPARVELTRILRNPTMKEHKLRRFLAEHKSNYDLVIIDCPPTDSILTVASYFASDSLIVPVKLEKLAIIGLPLLKRSMDEFIREFAPEYGIEVAGILLNGVETTNSDEQRNARELVKVLANACNWSLFHNEIKVSKAYQNGIRESMPIFQVPRTNEVAIKQFFTVGDEFLRKVGVE